MHEPKDRQVRVKRVRLTTANTTSIKVMELPDQASILLVGCFTEVASAGATLDMGILSDDDYYFTALNIATAQMNYATILEGGTPSTGPVDVYMNVGGAPAAGGPYDVWVWYTCEYYTFR